MIRFKWEILVKKWMRKGTKSRSTESLQCRESRSCKAEEWFQKPQNEISWEGKTKPNLLNDSHREREGGRESEVERQERRQGRKREKANIGKGIGEWDFVGDRLFPAVSSEPSGSYFKTFGTDCKRTYVSLEWRRLRRAFSIVFSFPVPYLSPEN